MGQISRQGNALDMAEGNNRTTLGYAVNVISPSAMFLDQLSKQPSDLREKFTVYVKFSITTIQLTFLHHSIISL